MGNWLYSVFGIKQTCPVGGWLEKAHIRKARYWIWFNGSESRVFSK